MRMYFLWQHSKFCVVIIPFSTLAPLSFDPPVSFIDDHASTDLSICPCLPRLGKSLELYIAQPILKGWIRQTTTTTTTLTVPFRCGLGQFDLEKRGHIDIESVGRSVGRMRGMKGGLGGDAPRRRRRRIESWEMKEGETAIESATGDPETNFRGRRDLSKDVGEE